MTKNYRDITSGVSKSLSRFREHIPDVMKSFGALGQSASSDRARRERLSCRLSASKPCIDRR